MNEEVEFLLIKWPESQEYMEMEGVYLCNEEEVGTSAYFVPKRYVEEKAREK